MGNLALHNTSKKLEKAVIYVRVSTEEQVENYSLDTQLEICQKEAEKRGIEVVEVFREEGRSAKTVSGRPELIRLLEYCRKNKRLIDAVIVYRLDRISRQTSDYLAIRKKLGECEIVLLSASEPTGNSPTEKFVETMLAGFAQMDNDIRSERTTNGMRARFLTGLKNGPVPLGYLTKNGYATKDPESWDVMVEAWKMMATGMFTLREMAKWLNDKGVKERVRGKRNIVRTSTLSEIFKNKFYLGKIVSKRYVEEVTGQHVPMITEEQFYLVQSAINGRNRNAAVTLAKKNRNNPDFPLRRIVCCSVCGGPFTGASSKGRKERYRYYFCQNRCHIDGKSSIPAETIEDSMVNLLGKVTPKLKTVELFCAFIRTTYHERIKNLQKRREEADEELKKLYEQRQALIEKNLSGVYSDEIFRDQNRMIEEKIAMINISKSDAIITKYNLELITNFVKKRFENLADTFGDSSLEQKKILVCSIFPSGVPWSQKGLSNTKMSPYFSGILGIEDDNVQFGGPYRDRTGDLLTASQTLYQLS